jgi:hypothetical protein
MAQASSVIRNPFLPIGPPPGLINFSPAFRANAIALSGALHQGRALWPAAGAIAVASIMIATLHQQPGWHAAPKIDRNQTLAYRAPADRPSFADRWEQVEVAPYQFDDAGSEDAPAAVEINRSAKADALDITGAIAAALEPKASLARLPSVEAPPVEIDRIVPSPEQRDLARMDEVGQYLWEVYQRAPTKRDSSGDFTWKDPAAAKRLGMSMPVYVIGGMDPDFREQLYHAGRAMDAAGIRWSMLSAFRDDYRQQLASGFKASTRNSLHGGSARTGGYGHGRAVDVTSTDDDPEPVWRWLDAHGAKFGLHRPMPGADPAHVQSRGEWRDVAIALRQTRIKTARANGPAEAASAKARVASASH